MMGRLFIPIFSMAALSMSACVGDEHAEANKVSGPEFVLNTSARLQGEDLIRAIKLGRERSKPIVAIHSNAMADLRANYKTYLASNEPINERICRASAALTRKHASLASQSGNALFSPADIAQIVESGKQTVPGCRNSSFGSLFNHTSLLAAIPDFDGPFGEVFELYYGVVDSTIQAWDGESDLEEDVYDAINAMAMQYPLYAEESDVLGAMVQLTISSYEDAMEAAYPDAWEDSYPVGSAFNISAPWSWRTILKKVAIVTITDVAGFYAAAIPYAIAHREDEGYETMDTIAFGVAAAINPSAAMTLKCISNESPCKTNP